MADESIEEIDPEAAERIARKLLAESLYPRSESDSSDHAIMSERLTELSLILEGGGEFRQSDIEEIRYFIREVEARLDEVCRVYGWDPADTGAEVDRR